jgi:hypothetical protein
VTRTFWACAYVFLKCLWVKGCFWLNLDPEYGKVDQLLKDLSQFFHAESTVNTVPHAGKDKSLVTGGTNRSEKKPHSLASFSFHIFYIFFVGLSLSYIFCTNNGFNPFRNSCSLFRVFRDFD